MYKVKMRQHYRKCVLKKSQVLRNPTITPQFML